MSLIASSIQCSCAAAPSAESDSAYYRDALHTLIDIGVALAREVAEADEAPEQRAAAFERVSRTVRRTVRLAQFVMKPPPARQASAGDRRVAARKRIVRTVGDHIAWGAHVGRNTDGLHEELLERLDAVDVLEDIDRGRPVEEIIEEIRCDLGLKGTEQFQRRTPADVAALCAWASQSPVAGGWTPEGSAGGAVQWPVVGRQTPGGLAGSGGDTS